MNKQERNRDKLAVTANKKICPILTTSTEFQGCLKEDCAWWDGLDHQCSVRTLAAAANIIQITLEEGGL